MKKIILVEDDPAIIDIYREFFARTDFDVELARTRDEIANELCDINNGRSERPDLILLDPMMGDGSGFDVLKVAKRAERLQSIPVFVLTDYENPQLEKEMEQNNYRPEKYLIKAHHTPGEIVGIINNFFGKSAPPSKLA